MPEAGGPSPKSTAIWDVPTRVVHWLMVVLVPFSWWSASNDHLQWHRASGYVLLALVCFRLAWGLVGSETARFASFLKGPRGVADYLRGAGRPAVGHNPLGGLSVAAMLVMLLVHIGLGLFAVDEDGLDPSPLAKFVSFETGRAIAKLHHVTFYVLLGLIALHLAAIAYYAARRVDLVTPMLTGRGRLKPGVAPPRLASPWIAFAVAALAATLSWFVSRGLKV